MRECVGFCLIVLLCGFAWGQGDFVPPGTYAQPSAPRLTTPSASPEAVGTPSLSLDSPSSIAGASNATAGNIAGAANSTLSVDSTGSGVQVNQPLWFSPGVQLNVLNYQATVSSEQGQVSKDQGEISARSRGFDWGAATFQSSYGAAQLAAIAGARPKATRVYTNPDVARVNENNGIVKFQGKTERVD